MMDQIGRYKIIGELGRGAMGVVYHATDPAIGRPVAIKTIRIRDIDDTRIRERLRERLFREARSAGVLSHPNIVTIYDMDEVDGVAYIAMAWVNGPTLEQILASEEPLSGARMLRILRQAASALDYAHGKGIVHRDVKPANIMTDEDGSVKITDFGIAKISASFHATETKTISGTPNYMSPEQVQGFAVDGKSDQFSLAVIAYEILTGERPFVGEHLSTIVYKIVTEEPPNSHRLNGTLTEQIDAVLRKGLSKKPEDRFPTCANFVGALELACAESRGWKTLPAGAAAAMPTFAVERDIESAPFRQPIILPPRERADETKRRSRLIPVLMSVLLVSCVGAIFVYQAGLIGHSPGVTKEAAKADPAPPRQQEPALESSPPPPAAHVDEKPSPMAPPDVIPAIVSPDNADPQQPARPPEGRLQDIWVNTDPPGAKAILDGQTGEMCQTPCMLHGASGKHHLAVLLNGYMSEYRDIEVGDTAMDVGRISLRQPTGTLMLATRPPGASIRINGELRQQQTPAELTLKPGEYTVTVERNGISRTERLEIGETLMYLTIPLNP